MAKGKESQTIHSVISGFREIAGSGFEGRRFILTMGHLLLEKS